jgi:hypothetical protein
MVQVGLDCCEAGIDLRVDLKPSPPLGSTGDLREGLAADGTLFVSIIARSGETASLMINYA